LARVVLSEPAVDNAAFLHTEIIAVLQAAVHDASRSYYVLMKEGVLYDRGVEHLVQVSAAKRLCNVFGPGCDFAVDTDESIQCFVNHATITCEKYSDISLCFGETLKYAIEVKRYSSESNIGEDVLRLREVLAAKPNSIGLLVAPVYMKKNDLEWPARRCIEIETRFAVRPFLSASRPLPLRDPHTTGWVAESALILEVRA
jgi:hypothetical protein